MPVCYRSRIDIGKTLTAVPGVILKQFSVFSQNRATVIWIIFEAWILAPGITQCLQTKKNSVSIDLSCPGLSFYEHFNRQFFILKTVRCVLLRTFYLMVIDTCLPKFDIYQARVAPNYFKSYTNCWSPDFFKKKYSRTVHLIRRNSVSTEQSVRA